MNEKRDDIIFEFTKKIFKLKYKFFFIMSFFTLLFISFIIKINDSDNIFVHRQSNISINFIPNFNPEEKNNNITSNGKKILYVSRHDGTISNMNYIAKYLGFDIAILKPDYYYSDKPSCYSIDKCASFVKTKCSEFDFIIIGDVISDSYIYLLNKCNTKIILEITNRFDVLVPREKLKAYYQFFAKAIAKNKNISIVENNPFEVYHACDKKIFIKNYYLIRPIGYPPKNVTKEYFGEYHDKIAVINCSKQENIFSIPKLKELRIDFDILPYKYGGPLILSSYKAIIFLPYQTSVMKMMENLRYGVAMIIPTENLIRKLKHNPDLYAFPSPEIFKIKNGLKNYVEFYNNEFKDLFIYFDSFDDLPDIIKNTDFDALKKKEIEFMKKYEKKALIMWMEVLDIVPVKENKISNKKPLCGRAHFYK